MNSQKTHEITQQNALDRPLNQSPKRIAITGGSGRVGTALRRALAGKVASIKIVDTTNPGPLDNNQTWEHVDVSDCEALSASMAEVDAIVHLAGYPNERGIDDILRVNILGTHNMLEAARRNGIGRVVFGSSNHTVGFYPRRTIVSDTDPMRPDSLYGLSKCWGELEAGLYFDKFGIRTLNIRIGNAGERPTDARALRIWVSPRDLAQLVLIGLEHPDVTCTTVYGISDVEAGWLDNGTAVALGYRPVDSAKAMVGPDNAEERPSPLPHIAEFFQGGRFCVIEHDGTLRDRAK
ncbi:NAD-dependent epimerase/dehydratase family protein [Roseinatronobacter alkalisoli]|uniref:NAD(P)-dependent oxidoreductase n=1 Tax=Roseinatronobacter alkalisoli TaxID=3028235 RepID=A0ABT5TDW9_9RHOB|nr:NAD(P)-dependent oxidoreductase [Roseinatronobacter sp. HJB301]MDD7973299.1 NAD(P)-dependent oxidoreductase [Roseinatronobacter sp. HJB301]